MLGRISRSATVEAMLEPKIAQATRKKRQPRNVVANAYDTCVLRLTRVRAQPQASISVTRVCIVFHATAYASLSGSSLQAPSCERLANS